MLPPIPENTVRAARASYGDGNIYLRLGDQINGLLSHVDANLRTLESDGYKCSLLAALCIVQYVEGLIDTELTRALPGRVDLRYALHLATPGPRLEPRSLCAFRIKTLSDPQYRRLFEEMFKHIYPEITATTTKEEPHIDDVIHSICENEVRATLVEAILCSMEALSANHFHWLRQIALPHWYQRYSRSVVSRDASFRKEEFTREDIQGDIQHLLYEIRKSNLPDIMEMPETKSLNLIWERLNDTESITDCNYCIQVIH